MKVESLLDKCSNKAEEEKIGRTGISFLAVSEWYEHTIQCIIDEMMYSIPRAYISHMRSIALQQQYEVAGAVAACEKENDTTY